MQNILKSNDRRLVKRIILEQREEEEEGTIYKTVKDILGKYDIDIEEIANMEKRKLKKIVKNRINKGMENMIKKVAGKMKKLRFIDAETFERKRYIQELDGFECIQAVKTKLNMLRVYGNYKSDTKMERLCPYCRKEEDTTEHIIECKELGESILTAQDLKNTDNSSMWRIINERTRFNIDNRPRRK